MKSIKKIFAIFIICSLGLFAIGCHSGSDDGIILKSISLDSKNSSASTAKVLEVSYEKGAAWVYTDGAIESVEQLVTAPKGETEEFEFGKLTFDKGTKRIIVDFNENSSYKERNKMFMVNISEGKRYFELHQAADPDAEVPITEETEIDADSTAVFTVNVNAKEGEKITITNDTNTYTNQVTEDIQTGNLVVTWLWNGVYKDSKNAISDGKYTMSCEGYNDLEITFTKPYYVVAPQTVSCTNYSVNAESILYSYRYVTKGWNLTKDDWNAIKNNPSSLILTSYPPVEIKPLGYGDIVYHVDLLDPSIVYIYLTEEGMKQFTEDLNVIVNADFKDKRVFDDASLTFLLPEKD